MANDDKNVELQIRAKNLTTEAFAKVSEALKALEDQQQSTTGKGQVSWGKWFATIAGGVSVGNLISDAFKSAAGTLASLPGQLLELGKRGNDVSDVRDSFMKLNAAIGQTGTEVLPAVRKAFGNTVSDYDLMIDANAALSKGAKLTAGDMSTLAKASRVMSDQVGGDSKEKWNAMMLAIANGQEKQLRSLPIDYAKIEKALDAHAAKLGIETSALTTSQKQFALRNAVLAESQRILEANGEVQNDYNDNLQAAAAQWQNIQDRVGEAIAQSPALNVALGKASEMLTEAFGPDRDAQIASIGVIIGKVAIAAVNASIFIVGAAQSIASAYYKARAAVDTLFEAYNQKEIARVEGLIKVYEAQAAKSDSATSKVKLRLQELRIELEGLKGYSDGMQKDANESLATRDKLNKSAEDAKKFLADLSREMQNAEEAAKGADGATKPYIQTNHDAADAVNANAKAAKDYADKVRQMSADVAVAIKNNALDTWAKRNATALQELVQRSVELGEKLPANLKRAFLESAKLNLDADAAKRTQAIMADALESVKKGLEARGKLWTAANDQIGTSEQAAAAIRAKMRMGEFEYQKYLIQQEQDAKQAALDHHASNYEAAMRAIDDETAARMDEAETIYRQKMHEMEEDTNQWGSLLEGWLQSIPSLLRQAFTGGGGLAGGLKSLLSGIGSDLGGKLGEGLQTALHMGVGTMASLAGPIGSAIGSLIGPAFSAIKDKFFGTQGRDLVKDFVASDLAGGTFDALHAKLQAALPQAEAERLWITLTQGVGRNNPEQAKAAIEAVTKALKDVAAVTTIDDEIAAAGFKTRADLQRTADTAVRVWEAMRDSGKFTAAAVQQAWERAQQALRDAGDSQAIAAQAALDQVKKLDSEIASLRASVDAEAPEEAMGIVEAQSRARIAALTAERAEAQKHLDELTTSATDAANAVAEAVRSIPKEIEVRVRMAFGDTREGPDGEGGEPEHYDGAYIRDTHKAVVHRGELVGGEIVMQRALEGAMKRMGGAPGARGPEGDIVVKVDGKEIARVSRRYSGQIAHEAV